MRMNAAEVLLAGGDDAAVAIVCAGASRRRGELRVEVARAAAVWRARGLARGERVAIKLADGIDWVVAYLSVIWAGGVAVGVNPRVPADEWRAILAAADFRFILGQEVEDTTTASASQRVDLVAWRDELAAATPELPSAMADDEPALWVHSAGTSGKPKAVVHAQRMAQGIARVGQERLGIRAGDRLYASSKLFFSYPLANSVFTGLRLGATVILDPGWPNAGDVAAIAMRERADVLFSVPSLYRDLLKQGLAGQLANCGVRRYVSAGEALPANLRDEWQRQTGCTIVDGYGASETLVLVLVDTGESGGLQTSPGFTVKPLDAASTGTPRRVLIKGPSVALGYWRRPEAQAEHFVAGGFAPSDLFDALDTARWRFAGRDDSLVKVHGRWVDLVELEQRIAVACPWLADTATVAVADEDGVEAVALFYVAVAGAPAIDAATLREHADRLPPHQRPRWLHAVEALPRTATGKLMRRRLRDLHATLSAQPTAVDHDRL
jgi:acyl-coenzyme A synthetase/AMP-(fatty) acid ligase